MVNSKKEFVLFTAFLIFSLVGLVFWGTQYYVTGQKIMKQKAVMGTENFALAFDGDENTAWTDIDLNQYNFAVIDFGKKTTLDRIDILAGAEVLTPYSFTLQSSNDLLSWGTVLGDFRTELSTKSWVATSFVPTNARYFRIGVKVSQVLRRSAVYEIMLHQYEG